MRLNLTPEQLEDIATQYASGISTLEIAKKFGLNRQTIANTLTRRGIQLRPAGPYKGSIRLSTRCLTPEQAQEAVEMFKAGYDGIKLAEHFGVSDTTVRKYLKASGITETDSRIRILPEKAPELVRLYESGTSTIRLAKQVGVSPETVSTALRKAGVVLKPRGQYRQLALREDAFDILTPASLYWLGVIATDGCVTGNGAVVDTVKLALKEEDRNHVAAFRTFVGSGHAMQLVENDHPANPSQKLYGWYFTFRSKHMVATLGKYGIVPRKTLILAVQGGAENSRDFWRGSADGDGHLGIHAQNQGPDAVLKLDGASPIFLEQFRVFLRSNGVRGNQNVVLANPSGSLAKHPKYVLRLGGNAALDAAALLYVNCTTVLLRKGQAAAEMILRGSRGELVGTIREPWRNERAEKWAQDYLARFPLKTPTLLPAEDEPAVAAPEYERSTQPASQTS